MEAAAALLDVEVEGEGAVEGGPAKMLTGIAGAGRTGPNEAIGAAKFDQSNPLPGADVTALVVETLRDAACGDLLVGVVDKAVADEDGSDDEDGRC